MGLYTKYLADEGMSKICSEEQILRFILDFEIALAKVQSRLNFFPGKYAVEIENALKNLIVNPDLLADGTLGNGVPVITLLAEAKKSLSKEAAGYLHFGATSQDVMDTAYILMIKNAVEIIEKSMIEFLRQAVVVIEKEKNTPCIARTRWQQAIPVPFALKVANWAMPVQRSLQRLAQMKERLFVVQYGGASGSLASVNDKGVELIRELAGELNLEFSLPWHAQRDVMNELVNWLSLVSGSIGKMGEDILLMSLNEVGEIAENKTGGGKSSSMPHKNNPVRSEAMAALAKMNMSLCTLSLQSMLQTGERDASAWMLEWENIPKMLINTAASLHHASFILSNMKVNRKKMLQNIQLTNGLVYAGLAKDILSKKIPSDEAKSIVDEACSRTDENINLADALAGLTEEHNIDWHNELYPEACFGSSKEIIRLAVTDIKNFINQ